MVEPSVFEQIPKGRWLAENDLVFAILDPYPASPGHCLLIPKRRVVSWFDATPEEVVALTALVPVVKQLIDQHHRPDGYNVGFNDGAAAGQTVFHAHLHLIPRYTGDVEHPEGGVRHAVGGGERTGSSS